MNRKIKIAILAFPLVLFVLFMSKHNFVYAQKSYPGVTISIPKNEESKDTSKKTEKKGYRGLIPGRYDYNTRTRTGVLKSKEQIKTEKEAARKRLQELSGTPHKQSVNKLRAEAKAREEKFKSKKANRLKQIKLPQTGDITNSSDFPGGYKLKPLDDINLAAMREDYKSIDIESAMLESMSLPPIMIESLMKNVKMQDGLSVTEKIGEVEIINLFAHLDKAKNASRKEKKVIYEKIEDHLEEMELRYEQQRNIPNRILLKLGLPKVYIDRNAKELDSVLDMIKSAQKELKKYR